MSLNGVKLTDSLFKSHCYVMKQHDKHWPYLTCRETLQYAAELYDVAAKPDIPEVVQEIIQKMGLAVCAETRCARLSGGQMRRLSIGIALLKQVSISVAASVECMKCRSMAMLLTINPCTANVAVLG